MKAHFKTDLHVHFAGALPASELVRIGLEHDATIDKPTAMRMGVVDDSYAHNSIRIRSLSAAQLKAVEAALELNPAKQTLFDDLDKVYANRAFVTKREDLFEYLLEAIAIDYAKSGVEYAELSYAGIISNPKLIKVMHDVLPRIEAETGVKLRFLGALWRHSDIEWNLDEVDRLKTVLQSPYIVGIDIMGHEKNAIRDLKAPLAEMVRWGATHVPGFVARVHAGENPYYSCEPSKIDDWNFNNTHESIQIVTEAWESVDPDIVKPIQIRIGHGRFGLHTDTLKVMADSGTIPELCLSSNFFLNHTGTYNIGPVEQYEACGISYTFNTDGGGTYGTNQTLELKRARDMGLNDQSLSLVLQTEQRVMLQDAKRFKEKMNRWNDLGLTFEDMSRVTYSTEDGLPRWNNGIHAKNVARIENQYNDLLSGLREKSITVDSAAIDDLLTHKKLILFSGASKGSWKNVSDAHKAHVEETIKELIANTDGAQTVFMTGGTNFGFEALVHKLVAEHNATCPAYNRINIIGALTLEAGLPDIAPDTISHAMILKYGHTWAGSWMDQAPALMDILDKHLGVCIMCGGGQVIKDMVLDAADRGLVGSGQVFLFDGPEGASTDKAHVHPEAAFEDYKGLAALMHPRDSAVSHRFVPGQLRVLIS